MYKGVAKISKDFLKGRIEIFKCLTVHVLNWRRCKPLLHMEFWRSLPRRLRDWSTWYIRLALYDSLRLINPMYFCNKSVTNLTIKLKQRFSFPLINSLFLILFKLKARHSHPFSHSICSGNNKSRDYMYFFKYIGLQEHIWLF